MPYICANCVKDASLKRLIGDHGIDGSVCDVCQIASKAIDAGCNRFQQLFKSLIRYHYNEWDYNPHWGGSHLESIFYSENPILQHLNVKNEDGLYSVFEAATENAYEEYDKGVTLYAGYIDGQPAGILRSLKSETHPALGKIEERLKMENHFNVEPEMRALLEKYKGIIDTTQPKDAEFLRARIGFKSKKLPWDLSFEPDYHYEPFVESEISAPPPRLSSAGRINRQGVSFFYAATNAETAITEVRPHPGDVISIGRFKTTRPLLFADFTETRIEHFSQSDRLLDDFLVIHTINVYLNKVVPPSERERYSVTQLIADTLRQLGYDGVMFLSTVGNGYNVVVFQPEFMEFKPEEGMVFEIQNLSYVMTKKKIAGNTNDYF